MCMGSTPKAPKPPPVAAAAPRMMDEGVQRQRGSEKRRLRMLAGRNSTLMTGGSGLQTKANTSATLLGGG